MTLKKITWPPIYQLRVSQRVKHIQWRFTAHRGLELVVPPHFKQEKEHDYLEYHRAWIEKILEKNSHQLVKPTLTLPDTITFPAFEKTRVLNNFCWWRTIQTNIKTKHT